jgi:hypothetical protein
MEQGPRGLLSLGHELPGSTADAASIRQRLRAVGVLGSDFPQGLQGVQSCDTLLTEEPRLWVAGVLGPNFLQGLQEVQSHGALTSSGEQSLRALGVSQSNLLHRLQGTQLYGTVTKGTEPAGLHLLLPVEQWELWYLLP